MKCSFAAVLSLLLAGCVTTQVSTVREPAPPEAQALLAEQRYAEAAQVLVDAAAQPGAERDSLWLRAAEAWLKAGNVAQARAALAEVSARNLHGEDSARRDLSEARIALVDAEPERALNLLAPRGLTLSPSLVRQRQELRGQVLAEAGQPVAAAAEWAALDALLPAAERPGNLARIVDVLANVDSATLQTQGAATPGDSVLRVAINQALSARGLLPLPPVGALVDTGVGVGADAWAPGRRLAVLLPLSGKLAGAGRAVLDGVLAAHFQQPEPRAELRVFDTLGTADGALAAYAQALEYGADRVLGPLDREAVSALFVADGLPVPVLALNRGNVPTPAGSASFALAPEDEAIAAAARLRARGARRVMLVGSMEEQSRRALAAFAEHFQVGGGEVIASVEVPDGEANFAARLQPLFDAAGGLVSIEEKDGVTERKVTWAEDYDALFIAMQAPQARLLVPQLASIAIAKRPIVATSLILAGSGDLRLDQELDGIEYPEFPWLLGDQAVLPDAEGLARLLPSARGLGARLFGLGADAWRLGGYLAYLRVHPDAWVAGVSGRLSLDPFGNVLRQPAWAVFSGGRSKPASAPALQPEALQHSVPTTP